MSQTGILYIYIYLWNATTIIYSDKSLCSFDKQMQLFVSITFCLNVVMSCQFDMHSSGQKNIYMCVSGFPDPKHFIVNCEQSVVKFAGNGEKCIEKCNFYIKYFDKIKFYADRPYLDFFQS